MKSLLDSFWRAAAYCLHPKVIGLSLLPLLIGVALALGLGWLFWADAVAAVRATLENWLLVDAALKWVEALAGASFRSVLSPLIVVALAAPVVVLVSVLLVAWLMTPAIVSLVATRRFPQLEEKRGGSWWASASWALLCTLGAALALLISVPLWFIPPLVLVVPPLIWGWLNYRVMSFDVLARHASAQERRTLMRQHRFQLLGIGVISGYLGAAPSLLWAMGAMTLIFAPLLIAASVWLYTLVFGFSSLWFTHYALAALDNLRAQGNPASTDATPPKAPPTDVIDVTSTVIAAPASSAGLPPLQP
jgi:hypothetical protein